MLANGILQYPTNSIVANTAMPQATVFINNNSYPILTYGGTKINDTFQLREFEFIYEMPRSNLHFLKNIFSVYIHNIANANDSSITATVYDCEFGANTKLDAKFIVECLQLQFIDDSR